MPFTITPIAKSDIDSIIRDKYAGDPSADISDDMKRLASGEPLAYVIGWQPFLGLKIALEAGNNVRALIPRPETEWWVEKIATHFKKPLRVLDLCAGSGAVGIALLSKNSTALVSFGELVPELASLIQKNIVSNDLDLTRATIRTSNLFEAFHDERFDLIVTNPPYIPKDRELDAGVTKFEPNEALFSGADGLDLIRQIIAEAPQHLNPGGELWMECDTSNIEEAAELIRAGSAGAPSPSVTIHEDLYGRQRLLVAHFE